MKQKYPHLYEYFRLGMGETEEGENYYDNYWEKIRREQSEINSTWMQRHKLGGHKEIHKVGG